MMRLYKTTIVFEVLHDQPLPDDLGNVVHETVHGHASGDVKSYETVGITAEEMKQLLLDQRSDPDLFENDYDNEQLPGV